MNLAEYQRLARRTQNSELSPRCMLEHALWGLTAEVGEVCSLHQKQHQGHALSKETLQKEIGDVLWFLGELCDVYGFNLNDIAEKNIEKLRKRYPEGFTSERSIHREV